MNARGISSSGQGANSAYLVSISLAPFYIACIIIRTLEGPIGNVTNVAIIRPEKDIRHEAKKFILELLIPAKIVSWPAAIVRRWHFFVAA